MDNKERILKCPHCGVELERFENAENYIEFITMLDDFYNDGTNNIYCHTCDKYFSSNMIKWSIVDNKESNKRIDELEEENRMLKQRLITQEQKRMIYGLDYIGEYK